jgi:hypothetical protein
MLLWLLVIWSRSWVALLKAAVNAQNPPADVLPDCALHCCLVAHVCCHHQDVHLPRLLLQSLPLRSGDESEAGNR